MRIQKHLLPLSCINTVHRNSPPFSLFSPNGSQIAASFDRQSSQVAGGIQNTRYGMSQTISGSEVMGAVPDEFAVLAKKSQSGFKTQIYSEERVHQSNW